MPNALRRVSRFSKRAGPKTADGSQSRSRKYLRGRRRYRSIDPSRHSCHSSAQLCNPPPQELVVDVIKEELGSKTGMGKEETNDWVIRKTVGGPLR